MSRRLVAFGVMLASGFAGLGYQIVWTQQSALWLGHEAAAVLAVVTAFFGGLALGALLLGGRIDRSHHPARWYAGCELLIAAWSLLLAYTMAPAGFALATLAGPEPGPWVQGAIALGGSFLLFLPATVSMGATLPAMARLLDQTAARRGSLGELYAANTFGAVVGVLATAFWLVPAIGLAATASWCAALNIGCAAGALLMTRRNEPVPPLAISPPSSRRILWLLSATGLLGIGYEVLVVRVISQLAENTVYTFAVLLAVYLLGTAGGAAIQSQQARRDTVGADAISERLLLALAVACSVGAAALWGGPSIRNAVLGLPLARSVVLGVTAEAAMALAAFALPTVVMGALFSHLCTQAREQGRGFGVALGVNTLGAAAAPLVFGVMLLPALGAMVALGIVVCGYLALGFWTARRALPGRLIRVASVAVAGVAALTLLPALRFVDLPEGGRLLDYTEGPTAAVSVVESAEGVRVLRVDNRQQEGSSATAFVDARQALLPLLLHPAPARALFLGLGTGVTAAAAAADPTLRVDVAELLPGVIEASSWFNQGSAATVAASRLHRVAADARRFVHLPGPAYDLIVADNFHPARSGSAALYTVEHFAAVRARLAPGGVFCQWLPLHQLDRRTLQHIVRSFNAVYPEGFAMLANNSLLTPVLGLVARPDAPRFDPAVLRQRLVANALPQRLADFGIVDELSLLGGVVAGPAALKRLAGDAAPNTDDRPIVAYRAPLATYVAQSAPADRLQALLDELKVKPPEIVADPGDDIRWSARLAAYWRARNTFIAVGGSIRPMTDVRAMLAQVQAPLLAILGTSPDFRPARDPLLRMARALATVDAAAARDLTAELQRLQAARL